MASSMMLNKSTCRVGAFGRTAIRPVRVAAPVRGTLVVSNSYKNLENINLSRVPEFAKHEKDTGSAEYQIARLTARIEQLSTHLRANRKDFSARRGLEAILSQRKSLLKYLYKSDRDSYDKVVSSFGIRSVIVGDTRGASRKTEETATA
eukprot:CAMPEP_0202893958 /NCGR_PEP_ID=MMETSP1392-20130828/3438_1 /ASSEMBLY_ACC=CAM_ASM_000868 /TAXON_ID=225041 /ORGANISM="Chlamydomonas chlamydogama, Strain SAG 11-48b" /LENGTH=148 /DNA_ID=CAMNT_0049578475 /DNA_START=59 /DNA_END=505 /DNA_ORIENTATION=+